MQGRKKTISIIIPFGRGVKKLLTAKVMASKKIEWTTTDNSFQQDRVKY